MNPSVVDALGVRAKFFRGLADPSRLALLFALRLREKTVGMLSEETNLSQSNVSNHLACLKDCGLVVNRQEWRHVYYRIASDKIETLLNLAEEVVAENAQRISDCANYCLDDK
ncbi:ArsR/SmtB family transcription factor [Alicyclobacillus dauci]|uniref:Metalloregulator ArsR/SmtB family transcription factor n=1 Tax=Alicyclobacillus dauci TaxID=1475485 RepID=A0ABY6Z5V2_9BACL|nr:metalloregulator ArsR/SmtB family transcription factor [Alicyclobacillus dauci]WAH38125.1 metalloregulator ArsR/SmtB family transcription factor [Alicyclobacillus dauci]